MKRSLLLVTVALCTYAAAAQSPSSVLKQAEKAMGVKNLKNVHSLVKTGTITRVSDGATGKYEYRSAQPNLLNVAFDLNGFEVETGYNGRSAWRRDSRDGVQTLTGLDSTSLIAKSIFRNWYWLNAKDQKAKIAFWGTADAFDGRDANILTYTTPKGVTIKLYFDRSSGLLMRDEVPNGTDTEVTLYSDYRDVNGVKMAFANHVTVGGDAFDIKLADIKANADIARSEFDYPVNANAPLSDIPALFKELQANEDRLDDILDNYSFTQKISTRELDKAGQLRETESQTIQLSFYKGFRITRTIEKNGKPLSADEQEKEDKDVQKQVDEIEKRIAKNESRLGKQESNGAPSQDSRRISIAEVLRASKLTNPRRERFRGRECVVFDFEPNPDFDLSNARSQLKLFGKTAGVMWIDEKDKQVARLEAVLYDSYKVGGGVLAKINKGAAFTLDKERVNDEIWLPSQMEINFSVRVLLVKGVTVNQLIKSYDYRRFTTEVKDVKVGDEKKP